jgi:hypothetical protein
MTEYKPVQECEALLDALEAELLAAPADEVKAVLAGRGHRPAPETDGAIAAALTQENDIFGLLPHNGFLFLPAQKGH